MNSINPQFEWIQDGQHWYISLGYLGIARVEFQPGEGYMVMYQNCFNSDRPGLTQSGAKLPPVPRYRTSLDLAKQEALMWSMEIIQEHTAKLDELIKAKQR